MPVLENQPLQAAGAEAPKLVSRPLPPLKTRVVGSVQTLDWRNVSEREQACRLLSQHAQDSSQGPQAPLLIKHAVSHWPALQRWDLQYLTEAYANQRIMVRCGPTMKFFYVEPRLLPTWRRFNDLPWRRRLPPSELLPMTMGEFVARLSVDCRLPNVAYPADGEEFYYCQAMLASSMLQDIDLYCQPFACLGRPGYAGRTNGPPAQPPSGLQIAQIPRMFLSPAGAISPLHFDTASSFLTQIQGRKRLVFYPPKDLPALYPYGRWHILRRRARVDPAEPDLRKYPKFAEAVGMEALLEPGDILWFPGYWSHYTESQDLSISLTYRFWTSEQTAGGSRSRGLLSFCR